MFKHLLITRFNLKVETWNKTRNGATVLDKDWMNKRFQIFERFCFPSVLNQSNKNFEWWIYFDESTSEMFKKKILYICEEHSFIKVFFIDGNDELVPSILRTIDSPNRKEFLITSRLDNDDIIHTDFIETVQNLFKPVHKTVIDLRNGFQLEWNLKRSHFRYMTEDYNHFISLVELSENAKTVFSRMHIDWKDENEMVSYSNRRVVGRGNS